MLAIHFVDMQEVRDLLARREKLNRIRELLSVEEVEAGSTLTELIDAIDVDCLTVQSVLAPVQDAKLAAYMSGLPAMSVTA